MNQSAKRIHRREIFKGKIFTVAEDTIQFPDGKQAKWDVLLHSGATAVVPIDDHGKIILVEQYRCVEDGNILEIPAGKVEKGEEPSTCAVRELEEETGYRAKKLIYICSIYSAVGFSDEVIQIYAALGLEEGMQKLDENEYVTVKKYTIKEIIDMIFSGKIKDSKTIAAIFTVKEMIESGKIKIHTK
ncbi:MAG: NUDIX hydrolase [Epulopiscium sp.]|nr:NUDIX hydrolase [Candidatus Epulonipiscium sp.]